MKLCLFNTHLESTAAHASQRIDQLNLAFKHLTSAPADTTCILAGDLNIRDKEVCCQ